MHFSHGTKDVPFSIHASATSYTGTSEVHIAAATTDTAAGTTRVCPFEPAMIAHEKIKKIFF